MKLFVFSMLLTTTAAVKCGTTIAKDCLGASDKRFDASIGYNLVDQDPVCSRLPGLYKGPGENYNGIPPKIIDGLGGVPNYLNITVSGSRVYYHRYALSIDSTLTLTDSYHSSTFEKDGSTKILGLNSNLKIYGIGPFQGSDKNLTAVALNGRSVYGSGQFPGDLENFVQETIACLELDESAPCSGIATQLDYYLVVNGVPTFM